MKIKDILKNKKEEVSYGSFHTKKLKNGRIGLNFHESHLNGWEYYYISNGSQIPDTYLYKQINVWYSWVTEDRKKGQQGICVYAIGIAEDQEVPEELYDGDGTFLQKFVREDGSEAYNLINYTEGGNCFTNQELGPLYEFLSKKKEEGLF